jgi:hypothetical protein
VRFLNGTQKTQIEQIYTDCFISDYLVFFCVICVPLLQITAVEGKRQSCQYQQPKPNHLPAAFTLLQTPFLGMQFRQEICFLLNIFVTP